MNMHLHISAMSGLITALYVIAILGTLNWLAMKYGSTNSLAASYCNLFGLDYNS